MKLERLVKDPDSRTGECPAVYVTDEPGTVVVQGVVLDADTESNLFERAADEDGVAIPASVLLLAADRYRARHPEHAAEILRAEQLQAASA